MTKNSNKQVSSVASSLEKFYERIMNYQPSLFIVAIVVVAASLFFLGGGVYNIITKDIAPIGYNSQTGQIIIFATSLTYQLIVESVIVMILGGLGVVGFLIAYRSTKSAYNPRQAYMALLVGCALLIVAAVLLESGMLQKFGL
ncbi:MAG: OST3/OST6 family protein [Candidatus Bathyarchaeota archaeon]|nr:OST3/OST6 family protein [Candidatus Bathyarchaeota archaeon]